MIQSQYYGKCCLKLNKKLTYIYGNNIDTIILNDKMRSFFSTSCLSWTTHPWLEEHNSIEFNDEAGLAFTEAIWFISFAWAFLQQISIEAAGLPCAVSALQFSTILIGLGCVWTWNALRLISEWYNFIFLALLQQCTGMQDSNMGQIKPELLTCEWLSFDRAGEWCRRSLPGLNPF